MFVQNVFDPPRAANIVGDKLVDAKEPWHCEQASERPECEPNRDPFMSVVRKNHGVVSKYGCNRPIRLHELVSRFKPGTYCAQGQ